MVGHQILTFEAGVDFSKRALGTLGMICGDHAGVSEVSLEDCLNLKIMLRKSQVGFSARETRKQAHE